MLPAGDLGLLLRCALLMHSSLAASMLLRQACQTVLCPPAACAAQASGFEVDFRLRGLIQLLNDHGFTTSNSCEDNHGHLWVEFTDLQVRVFGVSERGVCRCWAVPSRL